MKGFKGWAPYSVEEFTRDYLSGMRTYELSEKYKGSPDQVKRYIKKLRDLKGLPDRRAMSSGHTDPGPPNIDNLKRQFISFLKTSKTIHELRNKFGLEAVDVLLEED